MRKIVIVPTLLTLGNALCGFAAIAVAIGGTDNDLALSGAFILAAMVFDVLDGYAARLLRSASDFGGQLDSLCDAISFGLAPAFLLLYLGHNPEMGQAGQAMPLLAALYLSCALLRLARFNTENSTDPASHKRFKGLPSPAAAGCIVGLVLLRTTWQSSLLQLDKGHVVAFVNVWAPLGGALVSLLMVSRMPFPHFTNRLLRGRSSFTTVVQVVFVAFLLVMTRELACFLLFWAYALHTPARVVLGRFRRKATAASTVPTQTDQLPQ